MAEIVQPRLLIDDKYWFIFQENFYRIIIKKDYVQHQRHVCGVLLMSLSLSYNEGNTLGLVSQL